MNYKTKIEIAIGIGVIFIIIMAIAMFNFVQNNSASSENIINETAEDYENESEEINNISNNIVSIATKINLDTNSWDLVEVYDNYTSNKIVDLMEDENLTFEDYYYCDGIIYILYYETETHYQIYSIDLKNESEKEFVCETDANYINSFIVFDGAIYFVTNGEEIYSNDKYYTTVQNYIYKYDIELDEESEFISSDSLANIEYMTIDEKENMMYFMQNTYEDENCTSSIYKCDLKNNENIEELLNAEAQGQEILLYNNYLICKFITGEINDYYSTHYIYDINEGSVWELINIEITYEEMESYIAFSEDYIIFSDLSDDARKEVKIISDFEGNLMDETIYKIEDENPIFDIKMLDLNTLQIRIWDAEEPYDENIKYTYIINMETMEIEDATENYSTTLVI